MPTVAKHYQSAEIGRLIEQLARWPGWNGATSNASTLSWIADLQSRRRQDEFGPSVPVLGGEAADTMEALRRIDILQAECLNAYYAGRGTLERRLWEVNRRRPAKARISRRTFYRLLDAAHPAFWEAYCVVRAAARIVANANATTAADASRILARRYRLTMPHVGVVEAPQKPRQDAE